MDEKEFLAKQKKLEKNLEALAERIIGEIVEVQFCVMIEGQKRALMNNNIVAILETLILK